MATINPEQIVTPREEEERMEFEEINDFNDMEGISEELLQGIIAYGFERPSPIQAKAIMPLIKGYEVLAQAQSGTGKTGAFCIGSIAQIDPTVVVPQVLVFSHTRELAQQTYAVAQAISQFTNIKILLAVGGNPLQNDVRALQAGVHMIIGCPGRIHHLMNEKKFNPSTIKRIIIDEADCMLDGKFKEQIAEILQPETGPKFSDDVKIGLFSATLREDVKQFAHDLMAKPVTILVPQERLTLDGIRQYYVSVDRDDQRFDALNDIYSFIKVNQLIIFVNSTPQAEGLARKMEDNGHTVRFIHGTLTTQERQARMADFRRGNCRVLISTDLLARGIDVQQVSLIINYEMPLDRENYIHRIGRSGRFGRKGIAINIVTPAELSLKVEDIKHHYHTRIDELTLDALNSLHAVHVA